jgi:hypothetical protein
VHFPIARNEIFSHGIPQQFGVSAQKNAPGTQRTISQDNTFSGSACKGL